MKITTNRIMSIIFFLTGCAAYVNVIVTRDAQAGFVDPRMDVVAIALLGILAHFTFAPAERKPE